MGRPSGFSPEVRERTRAAVLAIRHLNKNRTARAKHRGSGSIGIIGAARSALLVARDPEDTNRRLLVAVKQNLCESASAVAFSLSLRARQHGSRGSERRRTRRKGCLLTPPRRL